MKNCNNYTRNNGAKQPLLRKPETKRVMLERQTLYASNGTAIEALVLDRKKEKDSAFVKQYEKAGDDCMDRIYPYSAVVWQRILRYMGYDNTIQLSIKEICEAIGCSATTATRALKELRDNQYIKLHRGTRNIYIVNPWKAGRVSAVYRPALEEVWATASARFFRERLDEIADRVKERGEIKEDEKLFGKSGKSYPEQVAEAKREKQFLESARATHQIDIEEIIRAKEKRENNARRQKAWRDRQRAKKQALQQSA